MKRKLAWLALPLLLAAGIFGAKWRADHPTPTKEDLETRALMSHSSRVDVSYLPFNGDWSKWFNEELSSTDLQPFTESFYVSLQKSDSLPAPVDKSGTLLVTYYLGDKTEAMAMMNMNAHQGNIVIIRSDKPTNYKMHPVTVKRWTELLLANPRIGPELRARMK